MAASFRLVFFMIIIPIAFLILGWLVDRPFAFLMPGFTSSEYGLTETMEALLLFAGVAVGTTTLVKYHGRMAGWLKLWVLLGVLGMLYTGLEEISYGQHYFGWSTSAEWSEVNDQQETNLHNTSAWLDQKPRILLEVGILVGGLIIPLLRRYKPHKLPQKFSIIYPDSSLAVIALLAIVPRYIERLLDVIEPGKVLFIRTSEIQEFYFFYFALLYFILLHRKIRNSI